MYCNVDIVLLLLLLLFLLLLCCFNPILLDRVNSMNNTRVYQIRSEQMKKSNIYWNIDYRLNKKILSYLADSSIHRQIMLLKGL